MKKENYIHTTKQRNTDFLFSLEKTQYVRFFYKLPEKVRTQYYIFYDQMMSDTDYEWICAHKWLDKYMENMTVEKFIWIQTYTDDMTYYSFYEYYEIMQPIIETIVDGDNLYTLYPEYLL